MLALFPVISFWIEFAATKSFNKYIVSLVKLTFGIDTDIDFDKSKHSAYLSNLY